MQADGISLVFLGTPRTFLGMIGVEGARGSSDECSASARQPIDAGHPVTPAKLTQAIEQMRKTLRRTDTTSRSSPESLALIQTSNWWTFRSTW